jgi:adenosine deaminase
MPTTPTITRERILALPKAELHVHLDGSLRPATLLELAEEVGVSLPASDPHALAAVMRAADSRDLAQYLERFAVTLSVMQRPAALERTALELALDAAAENVRYLEVRYSPVLHTRDGMSLEEAVEAPLLGLARAEALTGIRTGLIVCAIRSLEPRVSVELAELAVAFADRGVVAFDLAGGERGHPAARHREAFDRAARANLPITVHAGEAEGPWSIAQALHDCHARRIGHGTRLREDPALQAFVNDFHIPLEVCLTSNVQTRVASTYAAHPLRSYFDAGLVVTLSTDNRLISGTTLTEEYWLAHAHLGFSWEELKEMCLLGFRSAFLPYQAKVNLLEEVEEALEALDRSE